MEQLRAISSWSRPRSYRKRKTSLILRMDKAFWGMHLVPPLTQRRNPKPVVQRRLRLQLRKPDPETSISIRVPPNGFFAARIHIPGISIHIPLESLFTCPGICSYRPGQGVLGVIDGALKGPASHHAKRTYHMIVVK